MADVLVVDDDLTTVKMLEFVLRELGGHRIVHTLEPREASRLLGERPFDLVLLDVTMPHMDGFEVCKEIRRTSGVPILFVSGRNDAAALVQGLGLGGDDFLTKPFDPQVLTAKVAALLRRAARSPRQDAAAGTLQVGDLTLHLGEHEVTLRDRAGGRRRVVLTNTEFKLLLLLARTPDEAVSFEQMQRALWGAAGGAAPEGTLRVHVATLRKTLDPREEHPGLITNVRGVGYRLNPLALSLAPERARAS